VNLEKSTGKIAGAQIGKALLSFLGITYFARLLGPGGVGVFFLFQATMGIGVLVSDLGIQGAVEKRLSERQLGGEVLTTGLVLKLLLLLLLSLFVLLFRSRINRYLGEELAFLLVLGIAAQGISSLMIKVVNAELRVGETAFIRFSQQVVWIVVSAGLVYVGYGTASLIYGLLAGYVLSIAWAGYIARTPFGRPTVRSARSIFDYSKYNFVASASWQIHNWADVMIIGFFLTSSLVGAYEIAWRVSVLSVFFVNAINTTIFPQVSAWDETGSEERIQSLIPVVLLWSLLLVVPAFFGTMVLSREILELVFGTGYGTASLVLVLLMGEKIVQALYRPLKRILEAVDRVDMAARATIVGIVSNVALNVVLVPLAGIVGAAVATGLSLCLMTALVVYYLNDSVEIVFPYRRAAWLVVCSATMSSALFALKSIRQPASIAGLVAMVVTGALLYFGLLLINPAFRSELSRVSGRVMG